MLNLLGLELRETIELERKGSKRIYVHNINLSVSCRFFLSPFMLTSFSETCFAAMFATSSEVYAKPACSHARAISIS